MERGRARIGLIVTLGVAAFGLAACQPRVSPPRSGPPGAGTCPPPGLAALQGRPETVLAALDIARPHRIIHPGDAVTMDYAPGRVNFEIDENGTIEAVRCY
ncbi:hypothetical protein BMG03_14615 [Thioclava nitratireducens]|uniref:Peptidase inhibitor I78 family protein n=1 Tax=Thioclava nitratireducens TaxID=1915078 RepID=A0ABN4XH55_9RHOB|nr:MULTISPECIES: I78 family peptidase inhibitor [Thioclava]AQS48886.1 hypothetical protein BMG03_14615 [Thioclava nitratireducens]OWY01745.1 hypothetical protein B6V75_14320 [Thioclava sp. F1Mire-8]